MKCSVSFLLFLAGVFLFISFCSRKYTYRYPETPEKPVYDTIHGVVLEDPYRFLEDSESPFVKEWTKKQNILTLRIIRNLPFREELKKRIENLWNYPRMSVPVRYGNRYFYLRNDGLQNQSVLCVREGIDGEEKVLIDPNSLSDKGIISLDWWYPSEDGKYVAYGL
ncbi:MAG: S9 family peptidase, partial [Candidatus Neomarinimicrobiota bacterium]